MRNFLLTMLSAAALILSAASCGPSKHAVHVEMRYPSKAGVDLAGKVVTVVYLESEDSLQTAFDDAMANGFAYTLEQDYAGMADVGVYSIVRKEGAQYSSRDTLVNILMDTGADLVFLFDAVELGAMSIGGPSRVASSSSPDSAYVSSGTIPFKMKLYCYDAMNHEDKSVAYGGSSVAVADVYSDGRTASAEMLRRAYSALSAEAWDAGKTVASSFKSQWKHEQYSIAYYDSIKWYEGLERAQQYDWKGAMDIWMGLLDTNDPMKRSCAEYNISVACYMLGDYALASLWLDRSDSDNRLPLSDALRKRIDFRMK